MKELQEVNKLELGWPSCFQQVLVQFLTTKSMPSQTRFLVTGKWAVNAKMKLIIQPSAYGQGAMHEGQCRLIIADY